MLTAFEVLLFM